VLVTASVEEKVPPFLRGKGQGWVTAEYSMLPRATHTRGQREAAKGKQSGDAGDPAADRPLAARGGRPAEARRAQILLDCDVIQADGGTRTAAISGAWVALRLAVDKLLASGALVEDPIIAKVAAVSCGLHQGAAVLDLDYSRTARPMPTQTSCCSTAARSPKSRRPPRAPATTRKACSACCALARIGCERIFAAQAEAVGR
jgi:ribonuclease PH